MTGAFDVRVVHAADIHLDSPLRGLGRLGDEELAGRLRLATREAFGNLVRYVIEAEPDALVIAGDIYDGDWRDYSTGVHFVAGMRDLEEAGIPVVMIRGNHDAESVISRSLTLPPNVVELGTAEPQTHVLEDAGIAFHGQGFATRSVTSNLAAGYPQPLGGMVNVGLLHTSIQGYEGHDPYAPCSENDLFGRGYDYFALGHIHQRQVGRRQRSAWAFSGNLQGRNPRETGPKGVLDVRLSLDEEPVIEFVELDVARWESVVVDVSDAADDVELLRTVDAAIGRRREECGSRPVVARLELTGTNPLAGRLADTEWLGAELRPRASRHEVALERIRSRVVAPDERRHLAESQRVVLERLIGDLRADPKSLERNVEFWRDLTSVTSEVNRWTRDGGLDLSADATLGDLVDRACDRLLARANGGRL